MSTTRKKALFNAGRIIVPALIAGVVAFYSATQDSITPPNVLTSADGESTESKLANVTGKVAKPEFPAQISHAVMPGDKMSDGTVYAGISPDTGRRMYTMPADAPLTFTFDEARTYAQEVNALKPNGHDDWRVPTEAELNVLFDNRAAVGGFNISGSDPSGWYWSATPYDDWYASGQRFRDGWQDYTNKSSHSSLRLVRSGPPEDE